ncbi:GNAT family N-acetyltransferase [Vagococcus sp. JNUCC 83]
MIIKIYEEVYLNQIIAMIKDCIISVNIKDYTEKQVLAWSDIEMNQFKVSIPVNARVVLTNDNQLIGYGDMTDAGYLDRLFVHKDWQNQGVGRLLIEELEIHCSSAIISTYASITAKSFFESQGYNVIRKNNAHLRGETFLNFYMEKYR